VNNITSH